MNFLKKSWLKILFPVVLLVTTIWIPNSMSAEPYPNRPITVVIPWGAGGMSDTITRALCNVVEKELGQPIVVVNKAGGGGVIGINFVLKSQPDGYTLGAPVSSFYLIQPHMRKQTYDPLTDSIDITTIFQYNYGIAVRSNAPWNTYEELIRYAKNNPGKFTYATAGIGTSQHICMERMAIKEGIKWTAIPYKSGSEAVVGCLGGHTDAVVQGSSDMIPHIQAGTIKLLLTLDEKRWSAVPNVPSVMEKGFDFYSLGFGSLNAPKGVPEPIIRKIEAAFNKAKKDPGFVEFCNKSYVSVGNLGGKEYSALWRKYYEPMGKIIKSLGLEQQ